MTAERVTTRRRRVRPTPTHRARAAKTAKRPPRTVIPMTTKLPDSTPPTPRTTIAPNHEASPPTRRVQPARDVSAPCSLKRLNAKAAPNSGPATGTETERALADKIVAIIGPAPTRLPPTRSRRRCIMAKVAMDDASSAIPRAIHDHCGWPIRPRDLVSAVLRPSTSTTNAVTVTTDMPPRRWWALLCRSVRVSDDVCARTRADARASPLGRAVRPRAVGVISSHIRGTKQRVREQPWLSLRFRWSECWG